MHNEGAGCTSLAVGKASIVRHNPGSSASVKAAVYASSAIDKERGVPPFSSYLQLKAKGGLSKLRPWRKRFFILNAEGLAWFKDEADSSDRARARGSVPMHLLVVADPCDARGPLRFAMNCKHPRGGGLSALHCKAESPALKQRWLELIGRHINEQSVGLCFKERSVARGIGEEGDDGDEIDEIGGRRPRLHPASEQSEGDRPTSPSQIGTSFGKRTTAPSAAGGRQRAATMVASGSSNGKAAAAEFLSPPARSRDDSSTDTRSIYLGSKVEHRVGAIPGNEVCADCATSDSRKVPALPTWASTNLGVVFCIRCSGIHRKLGAHVSKVLSLQIDSWNEEQLSHMETLGNAAVNALLEASLPSGIKPDPVSCTPEQLEAFIRAKYELGSFKDGGDGRLPEVAAGSTDERAAKASAEFCGLLIIRLLRATNLPNLDVVGKTDAFVELTLGDRKTKSGVIKNSLNPVWNQTLSLNVRSLRESLILKVFDSDSFGKPQFIGQALIGLEELTHDGQPMGFDLTLQVKATRRKGHARLAVELTYNPLT